MACHAIALPAAPRPHTRGSRVKFSELSTRAAVVEGMLRVYTILCNCRGKIRDGSPYDSADAASLGALADGVHQGAQAIGLLLLRGSRGRPVGRRHAPGARP